MHFFKFLFIIIVSDPLDSSKGLPAVSPLNFSMDIILSASRKQITPLPASAKGSKEWSFWIANIKYDSFSSVEKACGRLQWEKVGGDDGISGIEGARWGGC